MTEGTPFPDKAERLEVFDKEDMPKYKRAVDLFYGGTPTANVLLGLLGMRRSDLAGEKVDYSSALFLVNKLLQDEPILGEMDLNLGDIKKQSRFPDFPADEAALEVAERNFIGKVLVGVVDTLDVMARAANYVSDSDRS